MRGKGWTERDGKEGIEGRGEGMKSGKGWERGKEREKGSGRSLWSNTIGNHNKGKPTPGTF